jgi:hypothetical protein
VILKNAFGHANFHARRAIPVATSPDMAHCPGAGLTTPSRARRGGLAIAHTADYMPAHQGSMRERERASG